MTAAPARADHVWWIVMENKEYSSIFQRSSASCLDALAASYGLATNYFATDHPSEPNYVAMTSGGLQGVTDDGTYNLAVQSIFSQLASQGRAWRAWQQNYPTGQGCFTGSSASGGVDLVGVAGTYARRHDPAILYTSVSGDPAQCANIQPLARFSAGAAPFSFITPNLCNDMHDCSVATGDAFLRAFVPYITGSAAFRAGGVLFITFDEGSTSSGQLGDKGGHVFTLIIRPGIQRGFTTGVYLDHYSLLLTTEQLLGLPCLGAACTATAMPLG